MSNLSEPLLGALSHANIAGDFTRLVKTYFEPSSRGQFCNICIFLDIVTGLFEHGIHSQFRKEVQSICGPAIEAIRDLDLGRRSDLLARSSNCLTCTSILLCTDEQLAAGFEEIASSPAIDCSFSAHFMDDNPVLAIAFGPATANAGERRSCLDQLAVIRFLSVGEKVSMSSAPWPDGSPCIYNPEQVDPARIREWLDCCTKLHGPKCQQPNALHVRSDVRPIFIDVDQECVVTPDQNVPYVALSYVWGPVETLQATTGNTDSLARPGSLSTSSANSVPATIRDAIKLCAMVGQRYLWVDRTYAKAEFTIVAADGSHADEGLAGLGRGIEERRRHIVRFPTKTMIRESTQVSRRGRLSETVWSSRAWTFQEHVFSRRLLYMDKFVSWICYSATWNELWSLLPVTAVNATEPMDQHGKGEKLYAVDWPSFSDYANLVERYNLRNLTYDSDVLNAFLGVMTQMCVGFPAGFYGGLPEFYFTIGLLWQPYAGLQPRFPQADCAPSWSWLGWSGKLDLTMWKCNTDVQLPRSKFETTITPIVRFFKNQDRADVVTSRVDDSFCTEWGDRWKKHTGDADSNSELFYTYLGYNRPSHIDTDRRFRYPIPPFQRHRDINPITTREQKLHFSTQRMFVTLGTPENGCPWRLGKHKDAKFYVVDVPIFDYTKMWVGSVRLNAREGERVSVGERIELIRIAEGSAPIDSSRFGLDDRTESSTRHPFEECVNRAELRLESHYEFYFVLWIEWDGKIARRRALGTVWKRSWDHGETNEVDIVLN
ncbi:hypothetical protein C7974DRAFT_469692 [Boeremia exigua]|uniref:uncharacterized protein n=1 Tax=Boeremia exigua TaxID=749465 RepID=UPI001E8D3F9F|nr:uncharacterized protein C7974DRAFT_469692 [Boeremia exigua]KAH6639089.1 hypothetical protein C7974DRAFT_469692 [Boeremia exigua]